MLVRKCSDLVCSDQLGGDNTVWKEYNVFSKYSHGVENASDGRYWRAGCRNPLLSSYPY